MPEEKRGEKRSSSALDPVTELASSAGDMLRLALLRVRQAEDSADCAHQKRLLHAAHNLICEVDSVLLAAIKRCECEGECGQRDD